MFFGVVDLLANKHKGKKKKKKKTKKGEEKKSVPEKDETNPDKEKKKRKNNTFVKKLEADFFFAFFVIPVSLSFFSHASRRCDETKLKKKKKNLKISEILFSNFQRLKILRSVTC